MNSGTRAIAARAAFSLVVISQVGLSGPCSACPTKSCAIISASAVCVCDHQDFGRAGEQVDADAAVEHPLCFGDETVTGADDNACRLAGKQSERQCRDALHAAEAEDLICPAQVHSVEHRRIDAVRALGRGTSDHIGNARNLGGGDAHDRGGDMGVATARHVAAGRFRPGSASVLPTDRVIARPRIRRRLAFCSSAKARTRSWAKRMSCLTRSGTSPAARAIVHGRRECCPHSCRVAGESAGGSLPVLLELAKHARDGVARFRLIGRRRLVRLF